MNTSYFKGKKINYRFFYKDIKREKQGHQVQKVRSEVELGADKSWLFFCTLVNCINNNLNPLQRINFVLTCSY